MYAILGIIKVKPQHVSEFVEHVRKHAMSSLTEPGCLRYDVLQDRNDPHTICLYEVFRNETDLDFHRQQEYYERWMKMSAPWRDASSYSRRVLGYIFSSDGADP